MADNTVPYVITRGLGNLAGIPGAKFLPTRGYLASTTSAEPPPSGGFIFKLAPIRWG